MPDPMTDGQTADEPRYGLPEERDPETGTLQPVEHTFEFEGAEVRIKLIPPRDEQIEQWQELGEDISPTQMRDILDEHLVAPDIDGGYTMRELTCYTQGLADYSMGQTDLESEVAAELEQRGGAGEGNSPELNDTP